MARRGNLVVVEDLDHALAQSGLSVRGGFTLRTGEEPLAPDLANIRSVVLIGNAGGAFWPIFQKWRTSQPEDIANPLDTWSRLVIDAVGAASGAAAVYPSDKPYRPFQSWAMRAQGLKSSPLGILMDPLCGPWHAYRGALLFDRELNFIEAQTPIHLCDLCVGKPCKKACPVEAHAGAHFAYQDCLSHVRGPSGDDCRSTGCQDRNACPYGTDYRYPADMQAFIMRAFAGL